MAIKYHPDKTKLDADVARKFKQVAVAHKVLSTREEEPGSDHAVADRRVTTIWN